jgi:16S rRNA (guanine(1405)-N(7))-methyltransferase
MRQSSFEASTLERLVSAVRGSAKYAAVDADLIGHIGAAELTKRTSLKDAIKATKNKLHQVGGMYLESGHMRYAEWLDELSAASSSPDDLRRVCRRIMQHHASTRERLPILDEFYSILFADIAPVQSVLDIACGLNPLAIPWMPLAPGATYHAVDIYEDLMQFHQRAFRSTHVNGVAETRDVTHACPRGEVEVALLLKSLSCLEHIDKGIGARLLDILRARHLVVSFPLRSVGGRNVGMAEHYDMHFNNLIEGRGWAVKRYAFETELVFLISK